MSALVIGLSIAAIALVAFVLWVFIGARRESDKPLWLRNGEENRKPWAE